MIDLHIHSTCSDGSDSPVTILQLAEKLHLNYISITDHEECSAYRELEKVNLRDYFSGRIIPGIELKSRYQDGIIDVLGYGIDWKTMPALLSECYDGVSRDKIQERQLEQFYEIGRRKGLTLVPINELKWNKQTDWACIVFYEEVKSHPENEALLPKDLWESLSTFRQKYYHQKGGMFYINRAQYYPSVSRIVEIIHEAGGYAFVAHIHDDTWMDSPIEELKKMITLYPFDGVECYHNCFSDKQILNLIYFCSEKKLLMSGGSDYHGTKKPDVQLACGRGI